MRVRRHVRRPPDLTSLFDVLFIVVFAALIRAAAVEHAAETPPRSNPSAPIPPPAVAELRSRALAQLDAELGELTPLVVRVSPAGSVIAVEAGGRHLVFDAPLLEHSSIATRRITYLGDRTTELQICPIVSLHLGVADLSHYLVIISTTIPVADLDAALAQGLSDDLKRCRDLLHTQAVLIGPSVATATPTQLPTPTPPSPPPKGPSHER